MHSRDRLCPSLDTLVPFDSEKPYDIKDVIFNVSVMIYLRNYMTTSMVSFAFETTFRSHI